VGHAFGGQALGLARNGGAVASAVLVASPHGWIGHWPWLHRFPLHLLAGAVMPLTAALLGRFPWSWAGLGEDLPGGVAREWARWSRGREFLGSWEGHAKLAVPILGLSFADDLVAPRAAVSALLDEYRTASVRHEHLAAEGLGHFGFFRVGCALDHWQRVASFLSCGR
jgi:predicted alpha/beta hydrolase